MLGGLGLGFQSVFTGWKPIPRCKTLVRLLQLTNSDLFVLRRGRLQTDLRRFDAADRHKLVVA